MSRLSLILLVLLCGVALAAPLTVQRAGEVITLRHQGEQLVLRRDIKIAYEDPYAPVKLAGGYTLLPPSKETIVEPGRKPNLLTVQRHGKTVATIDIDRQLETWVKAGIDWGGEERNTAVRDTTEGRRASLFNLLPAGDGALALLNVFDARMSEQLMLAQMLVRIRTAPTPAVEIVRPLSDYRYGQEHRIQPRLFIYYQQIFLYTDSDDPEKADDLQQLNADGTIGAKHITLPINYFLVGISAGRRLIVSKYTGVAIYHHTTNTLSNIVIPQCVLVHNLPTYPRYGIVRTWFTVCLPASGSYLQVTKHPDPEQTLPMAADSTDYLLPLPGNTGPLPYATGYSYLWHGFSMQAEASRLKVYDLATGRLLATHRL